MSNLKVIKRESLTQAVNKQLGGLVSEKDVVITGARLIKDGRLELEFAQARKLRNSKTSVLALINKGDDRFNLNNKQIFRVLYTITLEGAKEAFNLDFSEVAKSAEGISTDERVVVMMNIKKFFAEGKEFQLNIHVKESTNPLKLYKDLNSDEIDIENYELKVYHEIEQKYENVVNKKGKIIYQWSILDFQDIDLYSFKDDSLIKNKFLISEFYVPDTRLKLFKEKNKKIVSKRKATVKINEKVYITAYNLEQITRKTKPYIELEGKIHDRPIYFFSEFEIKNLLSLKSFINNPHYFIDNYYSPIVTEDHHKYVFEGVKPAYHKRNDCERLNSNYRNFEIPEKIKEQGKEKINEFRKWFKENLNLLNNPDVFVMRLYSKFGINTNPNAIQYDNTGTEEFENLNLFFIPAAIDKLVFKAADFYKSSSKNEQNILKKFSTRTFLAFTDKKIEDNDTGLSDSELKTFLKDYHTTFKKPIRNLIIKKFIGEANVDLKFDSTLLDKLGFKPCKYCCD